MEVGFFVRVTGFVKMERSFLSDFMFPFRPMDGKRSSSFTASLLSTRGYEYMFIVSQSRCPLNPAVILHPKRNLFSAFK